MSYEYSTPVVGLQRPVGNYRVTCTYLNLPPLEREIEVLENQNTKIDFTFEEASTTMKVTNTGEAPITLIQIKQQTSTVIQPGNSIETDPDTIEVQID